ncbi:MAG: 2,4-dihydroxyhept-2-ene-1,7-dioic acid aldolase [Verrucomicrobia bacterium]|nr:2,4-dihydroxyhept-2-ene-1,7-dioic acid aldolase [Verrucomicrobiota bacterium]MBV9643166.1 2,4-dihydroxyhept-2-ene-1,7-dioic acid aldolase [Verrucomicrobiota bacterium]
MRENLLKSLWQRDAYAVNGWLSLPSTFSAEVMAHQGWDSLTIDLQHGLIDYQSAVGILQAISTTSTVPLVRVPWLDPAIIMKVLDAGSYGVICPMINSAVEAREFVAACRYPPAGTRSCGPIRASLYAGPDYVDKANRTIITMAMIETRAGLGNLEEILSIEGLDAIYVGPSDLALALGCEPQLDPTEQEVVGAIEYILARAQEKKIVAGIHTGSTANAQKMIRLGFQFVTVSSDVRLLVTKASEVLEAMGRPRPQPSILPGERTVLTSAPSSSNYA